MAHWQQVSLSLPRCSNLFVLQRPRTLAQQGPHSSRQLSSRKCTPNDIPRRIGLREDIQLVGFTWVCFQLNCCCDSQSTYSLWGAWLRAGEGIRWLAAGTMPNSLYRMPLVYLSLTCVFCYSCSFLFVVCVFVFFFALIGAW